MNNDTADSEFTPKTFAHPCRPCNKAQTFEVVYRVFTLPNRNDLGEVTGINLGIEAQPYAYCQKCKGVIHIGRSVVEEMEEFKEAIEEATRRASSGLVVPKTSPGDLVLPTR